MSNYNFCGLLGTKFGKFYDNVSIEKIDGITMPVHYNGTDFVNLHPKDNQCEIAYIRSTSEADVELKDLGGCQKTPYMIEYFRFVHWSNLPINSFAKVQRFVEAMKSLDIDILKINTNPEQVYNSETGKGKYIKLKNMQYIAIDFKIKKKIDTCNIEC